MSSSDPEIAVICSRNATLHAKDMETADRWAHEGKIVIFHAHGDKDYCNENCCMVKHQHQHHREGTNDSEVCLPQKLPIPTKLRGPIDPRSAKQEGVASAVDYSQA